MNNEIEAIKDIDKIEEIKDLLKKRSSRDYLLFVMGINTGLLISDLLPLKVIDVMDKDSITIIDKKTGKVKSYLISNYLKHIINERISSLNDYEYLFPSRKGENKPLTITQAYRIITKACEDAGIKGNIGTQTLRKTFGYHYYRQFRDITFLQDIFNHSAPIITLKYIGIKNDNMNFSLRDFWL